MVNAIKPFGLPVPAHRPATAEASALLPGALTNADTDQQLIALWLRRPNLSADTHRAGAKEASRFLMWCSTLNIGLRDVRYEHLIAYSEFIADPQPADQWVSAVKYPRADPRWRPFSGKLGARSQLQALIVLKGLFRWAKSADYLRADPAQLLGRLSPDLPKTVERFLPQAAIPYLIQAVDALPADKPTQLLRRSRARFAIIAYYTTAARLRELVTAHMVSFRLDDGGRWWLHLMGKGSRAGKVPVPHDLVEELKKYRRAFGLSPLPHPSEKTPLLLSTRGPQRPVSSRVVARNVNLVFKHAAKLAEEGGDVHLADRIARASTHWLRHSQLTHQADAGIPLKTIQLNGRHADISTSGIYQHKEDENRHAETTSSTLALYRIIPRE